MPSRYSNYNLFSLETSHLQCLPLYMSQKATSQFMWEREKKRYIVPISYLNNPSFQQLLSRAEDEFGFNYPLGGSHIPMQKICVHRSYFSLECLVKRKNIQSI
ncbi:hypothetical protein GIB67_034634 [Kingdonia uniflora]|uniref:Uncharacterized protein n=1 Tax=Kingdonia uniflora TaxID=39325 RepID=A0A7J7L9D3_9MAGN|nr:hypothetical protein GIB67_002416 [Kingdonia uniflora]KAF6163358.1 hypothetical protein GIB67_034634 [Kingdonia uniflora]